MLSCLLIFDFCQVSVYVCGGLGGNDIGVISELRPSLVFRDERDYLEVAAREGSLS